MAKAHASIKVKFVASPESKYCVWIKGSILSLLSTCQEMWVTKKNCDEAGPDNGLSKSHRIEM